MSNSSDFCELCRLCATKTSSLNRTNIFLDDGKLRSLYLKITSCLPIDVCEHDFLPKVLCKDCVTTLESYYEFRNICIKTELFLKNLLAESRPVADLYSKETILSQDSYVTESYGKLDWSSNETLMNIQDANKNMSSETKSENTVCESTVYLKDNTSVGNEFSAKECVTSLDACIIVPTQQSTPSQPQASAPLFRCHYCKSIFMTRKESLDHLNLNHKKIHKCDVCNEGFRSVEALAKHKEKYLQQSKDKETMIEFKKRKIRESELQNKCKECGKQYKRSRELKLHERSHTGEKPFACKYCSKKFAASSSRNKHVQVHEKRWSHVCSFCGKGFVDKIHFTYHVQKQHTGERPFACTQCDKKFVRKQDLKMHKINFHSTKPRQCYKCDICNNVYTTMSYLKQHKQIHELPLESRKKYKCNLCDSVFLTNNKLKQHNLIHTGELPFECEICKKRYSSKMGLKIHLLIHSGVKKYVCEICSKPFALRNSLVCHRRTHTGERPYHCDICQQQFTQKSSLNTHRKRHTRDEIPQTWHN